ncbi:MULTISPECIES: CaiB/BaiF CoA transferase family protein [unclassified Leifsonia]|uniref:CaiB/BaiF CoA transferase family protein n=1 Tax=unclassified Leifsonia TaxID=2663824 RepID=UPI0003655397|nr:MULTISPECIES: CoA transferase [unclassified Leifsonia]TDQ02214.1 crotonobetainyl-CoA:carnitine CoA-transferase CaiB-like acyl-CoA transferase [Leifsonia sp. 115AMFTsu3.1]
MLSGVRVVDFSRVLAGPYATMMMADHGADVVKVESPAGDDTRHWAPPVDADGNSTYFASVNRNKRSVVCDLRTSEGVARARTLAESADVLVENFRPGVMAGFGLDEPTLRRANPGLVYCTITGFGSSTALPGYDLLVQALGGLMSITGEPDRAPTKVGVALVDVITGSHALSGVLMALRARERTGRGGLVEVDLLSSLLSALTNQASSAITTGQSPPRLGNGHPSIAPYDVYLAADRRLVIAVGNDRQFRRMCETLDIDLADDPRFATNADRVRNREELRALIEDALRSAEASSWVEALGAAGVPAGLVNTVPEAFAFAESLGLEPIARFVDPATGRSSAQPANPIRLSDHPARYVRAAPALGEHDGALWAD